MRNAPLSVLVLAMVWLVAEHNAAVVACVEAFSYWCTIY